jgi:hypothetical protein
METKYRIVRGKKTRKFYIEVGKLKKVAVRRFMRRTIYEEQMCTVGHVQYLKKSHGTHLIDYRGPRHYETTEYFDTIAEAQKKVDERIAEDRIDNSYTGEWQP